MSFLMFMSSFLNVALVFLFFYLIFTLWSLASAWYFRFSAVAYLQIWGISREYFSNSYNSSFVSIVRVKICCIQPHPSVMPSNFCALWEKVTAPVIIWWSVTRKISFLSNINIGFPFHRRIKPLMRSILLSDLCFLYEVVVHRTRYALRLSMIYVRRRDKYDNAEHKLRL